MATQQESNSAALAEIYKYAPSALVELFEIDLSPMDTYYTFPDEESKHYYYISGINPKAVDSRENYIRHSEAFNEATWTKSSYTATANTIVSPQGALEADTITGTGHISPVLDKPLTSGVPYTASIFVKYSANTIFSIQFSKDYWGNGLFDTYANFDLISGEVTFSNVVDAGIVEAGDGWFRCYATSIPSSAAGEGVQFGKVSTSGTYYVWGAQLEQSGGLGRYVKTLSKSIPLDGLTELYTVWQGKTYRPCPVLLEGIEISASGQLPAPTFSIFDLNKEISNLCKQFDNLSGANVIRRRTFAKFLDKVNFPGEINPTEDPQAGFVDDVFRIDRLTETSPSSFTFELGTSWDIEGVKLPRRVVMANTCPWEYKKDGCTWVPSAGKYYDAYDKPTNNASLDSCGKMLSSCRVRFGDRILPYGGFIGAGIYGNPL